MEQTDQNHINVIIADRPYRMKIRPEEEEMVRKAARRINEKSKDFQDNYAAKDKQDYLAMAALLYAVDSRNQQKKIFNPDDALYRKLDQVEKVLAGFVGKTGSR